jgi:hypothetical protein
MKLKHLNYRQIGALIKKDVLVRLRQPVSMKLCLLFFISCYFHTFFIPLRLVDDNSSVPLALRNFPLFVHFKIKIHGLHQRRLSVSHAPASIQGIVAILSKLHLHHRESVRQR